MAENKKRITRKEVKEQLEELTKLFQKLPKSKLKKLIDDIKVKGKPTTEKPTIEKQGVIQDTIDYLRVCIKYTLLDAESYDRENKYLRKLLKENGSE